MATSATDNLLHFPNSWRDSSGGSSLAEARDLMARRLREAIRVLVGDAKRELTRLGNEAEDHDSRRLFYETHDALLEQGARLEVQLAGNWQREFDAAASGRPQARVGVMSGDDLQLVDQGEVEEDIVLRALAAQLREACEEDIYGIACRLGALAGRKSESADFNPAAPEVVCRALRGALSAVGFTSAQRGTFLRSVEHQTVAALRPVFGDLNNYLLRLGLLPTLKRTYSAVKPAPGTRATAPEQAASQASAASGDVFALLRRLVAATPGRGTGGSGPVATPAQVWASLDAMQKVSVASEVGGTLMPAVNSLHEFRASPVGRGLNAFDSVTVDIVAMLFDFIFDDKKISDPIKTLVGRLQIPVLKVAMLDKGFFASRSHPARRLLDGISRAAVRWGRSVDNADPLYRQVAHLVDRVRKDFRQDTALFETLCAELDAFLQSDEQAAETRAARAVPLLAQRERDEVSVQVAQRVVASWLAQPLPPVLADLFDHEWRTLLIHQHTQGNDAGWGAALRVAGDLMWSVQPKKDAAERKALVAKLPVLVRELQQGLDLVGTPANRRLALTDALFGLHAAVLRGSDLPEPTIQASAEKAAARLATQRLQVGDVIVDCISATAMPELRGETAREVDGLKRGDWVEFSLAGQGAQRHRLSWLSPERDVLLFTGAESPRAIAVSPAALALQIQLGEAAIVHAEPIFERAVTRAIEALKAA